MPRSDEDNQQLRDARRGEILAAGTRVFAERGLARTKVTEIAAAAGLSHGLIYHYFPSKGAVFEAITTAMIERSEAELSVSHGRAIERLVSLMVRRRDALERDPADASCAVLRAVLQGEVTSAELQRRLSDHFDRLRAQLTALVADAQRDGDIEESVPAAELTGVLMLLFRGMAIRIPEFQIHLPQPNTLVSMLRLTPAGVVRIAGTTGKGAPR